MNSAKQKEIQDYLLCAQLLCFSIQFAVYFNATRSDMWIKLSLNQSKGFIILLLLIQTFLMMGLFQNQTSHKIVSFIIIIKIISSWIFYLYNFITLSQVEGSLVFASNILIIHLLLFASYRLSLYLKIPIQPKVKKQNHFHNLMDVDRKRWITLTLFIEWFFYLLFGFFCLYRYPSKVQLLLFLITQNPIFLFSILCLFLITQLSLLKDHFSFQNLSQFEDIFAIDALIIQEKMLLSQDYQCHKIISNQYFDEECLHIAKMLRQTDSLTYLEGAFQGVIQAQQYCLSSQAQSPLQGLYQRYAQEYQGNPRYYLYEEQRMIALFIFDKPIREDAKELLSLYQAKGMLCFIYSHKRKEEMNRVNKPGGKCYNLSEYNEVTLGKKLVDLYKKHHRLLLVSEEAMIENNCPILQFLPPYDLKKLLGFLKIRLKIQSVLFQNLLLSFLFFIFQMLYLTKAVAPLISLHIVLIQTIQIICLFSNCFRLLLNRH